MRIRRSSGLRGGLAGFALRDPIPNIFLFHDLLHEEDRCEAWILEDSGKVRGYVLRWIPTNTWVVEADESEYAERLLKILNPVGGSLIIDARFSEVVEQRLKKVTWYLMYLRKGDERLYKSGEVIPLDLDDIDPLIRLYGSEPEMRRSREFIEEWVRKLPIFGLYKSGELVSAAGILARSRYGGMIGGVITHPAHRRKGYAAKTTSAATNYILWESGLATLYVDVNNSAAVNLYRKLGYRIHSRRLFIRFSGIISEPSS